MFLPKPKSGATSVDADGKIVHVEVREDEEQGIKLQEIVDLLVAAGYFRARIKGLSSFDKVVGGLVWCIENCSFDVDVDLLFQENLTIGQRIGLTEKIVAVLPSMGCPHRIEPHQIQGLDCIHIYPVIQWLVKRSIETRRETGAQIRALAVSQFARLFPSVANMAAKTLQEDHTASSLALLKEVYGPVRRYRRRGAAPVDEESQLQSTLLEYGWVQQRPQSTEQKTESPSEAEAKGEEASSMAAARVKEQERVEKEKLVALMQGMDIALPEDSDVAAAVVSSIVGLRADEVTQDYLNQSKGSGSKNDSLAKQITDLENQRDTLIAEVARLEQYTEELSEQLTVSQQKASTAKQAQMKLRENLGAFAGLDDEPKKGAARQLLALLSLHENLAQQEAQFKQHCRAERDRLQSLVENAGQKESESDSGDTITPQLEKEREQLSKLRVQLGRKNRVIAGLQRQLDEVPGRAELAQYQRRFLELYTQVSGKHRETKQYYTLYNTLHDTQLYLSKELALLNSIQDNYTQAMSSSSAKEQFLTQCEAIVKGIKDNKAKVAARRDEERARRDRLSRTLLGLVEQQRAYVAAVTQLTAECRHNEALLAQLRAMSEPRQ